MRNLLAGMTVVAVALLTASASAQQLSADARLGSRVLEIEGRTFNGEGFLTQGGTELRLEANVEVEIGDQTLRGGKARKALGAGTAVRILSGRAVADNALVAERLKIVPR